MHEISLFYKFELDYTLQHILLEDRINIKHAFSNSSNKVDEIVMFWYHGCQEIHLSLHQQNVVC